MDDHTPIVSLRRTLSILLIVYGSSMLTALLAGATIIAHVDPLSECILYSTSYGNKLEYGAEAYCETIGYLFLACIVGSMVMMYLTYKHRRALIDYYKSGHIVKSSDTILQLKTKLISLHFCGSSFVTLLTLALTAGYVTACNNLEQAISGVLTSKLNSNTDFQERIDEKFVHDNVFWRYTGQINNAYGSELYSIRITCRTIFTDPSVHQRLHETHTDKYSSYFSYWYKQDLYTYNPQSQAVLTNALIEASLAGGWLSTLLWVGSFVFMLIQRFYIKKKAREVDRVSLHSGYDGTLRKEEMSMISGSFAAPHSMLQRGGIRGSDRSIKSTRSRRDMDDLAFAMHGVSANGSATPRLQHSYPSNGFPNSGTLPRHQQSFQQQPYNPQFNQQTAPFLLQNQPLQQNLQYSNGGAPYQQQQAAPYTPNSARAYTKPHNPDTTYIEREHVETEIM